MAVLTTPERKALSADVQREVSRLREPITISKADLQAAINATDDWVEANSTSFNTAIPLPARTALTLKQKTQLFMRVVRKRFENL